MYTYNVLKATDVSLRVLPEDDRVGEDLVS